LRTLLDREEDHAQEVVLERGERRVVAMDSARYTDARNRDRDVVVAASYIGVLPARMMAMHRPRGVIGHDACIGKDAAGIQGLPYLEALGIPAVAVDGMTAELGNGLDMWETGRISRVNVLAEQCGVTVGMPVREAAELLLVVDPTDVEVGHKIRREVMAESPTGRQIVVTDSIVFCDPEADGRNVLVTAGHTGRSGADFLIAVSPWGFICSDGGMSKNDAGIAGLAITEQHGLAGATVDAHTAEIGDAFSSWRDGVISACNEPARRRGVRVGQTAQEAAACLLREDASA
jgi:uncharacterized protein YunC (DUF1805 family)